LKIQYIPVSKTIPFSSHVFFHSALSVAAEQYGSEPRRLRNVGNPTRVCVKHHRITDVEKLRQRVEEEWDRLDHEVIDNTISECCKRLTPCIAAGKNILSIHSEHYCICSQTD